MKKNYWNIIIIVSILIILWNFIQPYYFYWSTPIDIVYLWVDANDPTWLQKNIEFKESYNELNPDNFQNLTRDAIYTERYKQINELYYSILSVKKYMNWVRNIYVVVDEQKPEWFDDLKQTMPNIHLVDIREIMEPQYIPCYNSIAIETNIYKIPGLSEYFLYFNDDMFVGNHISKQEFIRPDGKIIVIPHHEKIKTMYKEMTAHKYHIINMKRMLDYHFGEKERTRIQHVPLLLRKSIYKEIVEKFPEEIRNNHTPFRDKINFHIHYFVQWYMIEKKLAYMSYIPNVVIYQTFTNEMILKYLENIQKGQYKLFCINTMSEDKIKELIVIHFLKEWEQSNLL
jgi:hypothetical protein